MLKTALYSLERAYLIKPDVVNQSNRQIQLTAFESLGQASNGAVTSLGFTERHSRSFARFTFCNHQNYSSLFEVQLSPGYTGFFINVKRPPVYFLHQSEIVRIAPIHSSQLNYIIFGIVYSANQGSEISGEVRNLAEELRLAMAAGDSKYEPRLDKVDAFNIGFLLSNQHPRNPTTILENLEFGSL